MTRAFIMELLVVVHIAVMAITAFGAAKEVVVSE
jgi:hypothetical protein